MEKLNIGDIRGRWLEETSGGDDTTESLKTIARKVNEIIDHLEFPQRNHPTRVTR
jgi:hypothetical protein